MNYKKTLVFLLAVSLIYDNNGFGSKERKAAAD